LKLTLADFGGSTNLFSISAELTAEISDRGSGSGYTNAAKEVTTMSSGDILCAMVFIGENEEFVLLSNAAQNGENKLTSLSILQLNLIEGYIIEMQECTEFLSSAVLVTGALLISQGDCFIRGHLFMNVSILENTNDQAGSGGIKYPILQDKIIGNPSAVSLLLCLLQPATDTPPTSDDEGSPVAVELSALEIAAIGLAFAILTLTILTIFWLCIWYHKRIERRRKNKLLDLPAPPNLGSSMMSNAVYVSDRDSLFPASAYSKYTATVEMNERYAGALGKSPESHY
jgi:hypothetical protein